MAKRKAARVKPAVRAKAKPAPRRAVAPTKPARRAAAKPQPPRVRAGANARRSIPVDEPRPRSKAARERAAEEVKSRDDGALALSDEERPLPKSKLGRKELSEFRQLLLAKRKELLGDVQNLTDEALKRNRQEASGDLSNMPIHMADIGSDNWEQEFTIGLLEQEKSVMREIDEALDRIEAGTYGVCLATHRPITLARLRAKPWAKHSIEYERMKERERFR